MMKKKSGAGFMLCLLGVIAGTLNAGFIESYTARLGPQDHHNSRGMPLRKLGEIIQQDRANYHRYSIRDPQDQYDGFFRSRRNRSRIQWMLRRGWVDSGLRQSALYGTPLVQVDVYSDRIDVRQVAETVTVQAPTTTSTTTTYVEPAPVATTVEETPGALALKILAESASPQSFGFTDFTHAPLRHEVIGEYKVEVGGTSKILVVTASRPVQNFECHACAPKLSFFLYEKQGGRWLLRTSYLGALFYGAYGEGPQSGEIQVVNLGNGAYGVMLQGSYSNMGWLEESRLLLVPFGDTMSEAIRIITEQSNSGVGEDPKTDVKASYRFVAGPSPYLDIDVRRWGVEKGRSVDENRLYRFDPVRGKYLPLRAATPAPVSPRSVTKQGGRAPENGTPQEAAPATVTEEGFVLPDM